MKSAWLKAIHAGLFTTWPGITAKLVNKYLNKELATSQGHLNQQHQGTWSTKDKPTPPFSKFPSTAPTSRTNKIYLKMIKYTGQIYTDQPGRFPVTSIRGNTYLMVLYEYNSNTILEKTIKSRSKSEFFHA